MASWLLNTMVTLALVTPAWPCLYTSSCRLLARTCDRLVMPSTKQMASSTFDLPLPLSPVMALKRGSNPLTTVRVAYDLKPSRMISSMCMAAGGETRSLAWLHSAWLLFPLASARFSI